MLISIVGPYDRSMLEKGMLLKLKIEDDNFNSISAIYNESVIGKVAENDKFTQNKIKSSELRDLLRDEKVSYDCEIVDFEEVIYNNNSKDAATICKLFVESNSLLEEDNMGGDLKMENKVIYDIELGGNLDECKAKLIPTRVLISKDDNEDDIKELKLKFETINNELHVVIGEDSKYYTESDNLNTNSIGVVSKILNAEMKIDSFTESLKSFANVDLTFKEVSGIQNIVTVELHGNKILNSIEDKDSKLDLMERLQHLDKFGIPNKMKEKAMTFVRTDVEDLSLETRNRIPNKGFQYIPQETELIQVLGGYHSGLNILLEGNKASGKNTLIEDIGYLYNQPVFELQVNAEINNSDILGMKSIEPVIDLTGEAEEELKRCIPLFFEGLNDPSLLDKQEYKDAAAVVVKSISGGETRVIYEPSPLIEAMEVGGILVLDEINTGHPSILSILNPILDNRKRIDVPGYKPVIAHPDFRVFATMNKGYAGTMGMNSATHSRFMVVEMEPAKTINDIMKKEFPEINKELLMYLDRVYKEILKGTMGRNATLTADAINIRAFKNAVHLINEGVNVKSAFDLIASSSQDDFEREAIRNIIQAVLP